MIYGTMSILRCRELPDLDGILEVKLHALGAVILEVHGVARHHPYFINIAWSKHAEGQKLWPQRVEMPKGWKEATKKPKRTSGHCMVKELPVKRRSASQTACKHGRTLKM